MDVNRALWRKASYSSEAGDNCVELAALGEVVGVRDSQAPETGHLTVDRASLRALVARIKA
ncbi:DUF397 domain-containing protein [Actinomadura hibisca]|uniref:DUF397 domain-containing protein n=1 Tax=Actinomadura hibisca TaxID=68565 RepID=UPI00082A79A2|nr:DUF397 domain-containing protein [Actinomadura hibisca]